MYDEYSEFGRLAHPAFSPILAAFGGTFGLSVVVTEEVEHCLELVWETLAISTPIAIPLSSQCVTVLTTHMWPAKVMF